MGARTAPGAGDARRRGSVDRGARGTPGALRCDRKQENDHHGGHRLAREEEERGGNGREREGRDHGDLSDRTDGQDCRDR
jgi:hypothetical protein